MANNALAMFQVETPQDVQARLQHQRQQQWASGNPYQMQQATIGNALDALFGNPQTMQAQKVTAAMQNAEKNVMPVEGATQLDTEMSRLQAMRDAVADVDPGVASRINQQMLQLGQIKFEQDKLMADQRLAVKKDARADAALGLKVGLAEADRQNWMNPKTGEMLSIPKMEEATAAALSGAGWVEAGNPTLSGSKGDITGLSKPVVTDLQTAVFDSQKALDTVYGMAGKWKPEFSTIPKQVAMAGAKWAERLTGHKVDAKFAADAGQFYEWRRNTTAGLNAYIKSITGAQAAVAEYERIEKSFPNANMGPTEYLASLRETAREAIGISKRAQQALASGMKVTPEMQTQCQTKGLPCIWDSVNMPNVSDAEVDNFLAPLGIPGRGGVSTSGSDADGWQTINGRRVRVKPQ